MAEEYIGRKYITAVDNRMDQDGFWHLTMTVVHQRSLDLLDWQKEEMTISVLDKDLERAMLKATMTISTYLEEVDYDLFKPKDDGDEPS